MTGSCAVQSHNHLFAISMTATLELQVCKAHGSGQDALSVPFLRHKTRSSGPFGPRNIPAPGVCDCTPFANRFLLLKCVLLRKGTMESAITAALFPIFFSVQGASRDVHAGIVV